MRGVAAFASVCWHAPEQEAGVADSMGWALLSELSEAHAASSVTKSMRVSPDAGQAGPCCTASYWGPTGAAPLRPADASHVCIGQHVVATVWRHEDPVFARRMGVVYCTSRPCSLYSAPVTQSTVRLAALGAVTWVCYSSPALHERHGSCQAVVHTQCRCSDGVAGSRSYL